MAFIQMCQGVQFSCQIAEKKFSLVSCGRKPNPKLG